MIVYLYTLSPHSHAFFLLTIHSPFLPSFLPFLLLHHDLLLLNSHAFQLGQGKTGGIMDYGDGIYPIGSGIYQFHPTYNQKEMSVAVVEVDKTIEGDEKHFFRFLTT